MSSSRAARRRAAGITRAQQAADERAAWDHMDKKSQRRVLMLLAERYVDIAIRMNVDRVLIGTHAGVSVLEVRAISEEEAEKFFASGSVENPSHMVQPTGEEFSDMLRDPEKKHAD